MKVYTKEERIDMIFILGECLQNSLLASRVYAERFPNRNHPNRAAFERLLVQFKETGSVQYKTVPKRKPITENEDIEFAVIAATVENPHIGQNEIAENNNISQASVSRVLSNHNYHPYKIQRHQELLETDFNRRVQFCMWVLDKVAENDNFFDRVLFSDECTFHNNGSFNRHNFHYYSDSNPYQIRIINNQHRWSVNVWGGIMGSYVIGPYFFEENLNGTTFMDFLANEFPILLENIPLELRRTMWLQMDGAPPHFDRRVRQFLNDNFHNRWIGRGGPIEWPPRSPDLTAPDFFLWGYVKNIVFKSPPTTPENMKERIREAFRNISQQILFNVANNFKKRVRLCLESDGRHFEHLI